jgi:hypothetical protein
MTDVEKARYDSILPQRYKSIKCADKRQVDRVQLGFAIQGPCLPRCAASIFVTRFLGVTTQYVYVETVDGGLGGWRVQEDSNSGY